MPRKRAVDRARELARSVLILRAQDLTTRMGERGAVVVAPHPDDETLGCGAVLARKAAAGLPVTVVVVSDGRGSHRSPTVTPEQLAGLRREEAVAAAAKLGAGIDVEFLDFPDGELAGHRAAITARLAGVLAAAAASSGAVDVFSPALAEPPSDHSAVSVAVRDAVAGMNGARLLEYPVWMWSRWPLPPATGPAGPASGPAALATAALAATFTRPAVKVATGEHLPAKRAAIEAYRTQVTRYDGSDDWLPLPAWLLQLCSGPYEVFFPVGR